MEQKDTEAKSLDLPIGTRGKLTVLGYRPDGLAMVKFADPEVDGIFLVEPI